MAEDSGIEWTTHTFNPWIGCTKVSPACDHCYAEVWDNRFKGERWGPHAARTQTKTWGNPVKWDKAAAKSGVRPRVFCASLADVFDNHKSIETTWRDRLWRLVEDTPNLDWLFLTKRPQNIKRFVPGWMGPGAWPENVWIGTTVEDQTSAQQRVPHLLDVPARVRFLSCEPLIGPVDLTGDLGADRINWVIAGGESGPQHRPSDAEWFRTLRDQCAEADVPFLFKQWGGTSQKHIKAKGRLLDGVQHDGYPNA